MTDAYKDNAAVSTKDKLWQLASKANSHSEFARILDALSLTTGVWCAACYDYKAAELCSYIARRIWDIVYTRNKHPKQRAKLMEIRESALSLGREFHKLKSERMAAS